MKISLSHINFSWPGGPTALRDHLGRTVEAADAAGLDTVWVADHLLQGDPTSTPEAEMLEAYTTLGYVAARTERVRLGTMVTAVTYREPAVLIKAVTTLDVLSGGRAWFGVGSGYHAEEAAAMGLFLPPTRERFDRLDAVLRLALRMWEGDDRPFVSEHYRLDRPINSPTSIRRPHPPILVGGSGETRTLPLVAKYADACNLPDLPDDGRTVRHKLDVLAGHCAAVERPFAEIEKTISTRLLPGESADSFVQRAGRFAEWGIDHAIVITAGPWTEAGIGTLGEAVAQLGGR